MRVWPCSSGGSASGAYMARATSYSGAMLAMRIRPRLTRLPLAVSVLWLWGCWCSCRLFQHQANRVLSPLRFLHAVPVFRQGRNLRQPPHLGLLELGNPALCTYRVCASRKAAPSAHPCVAWCQELVDPQAADVHRLAGPFAAVALVHECAGAVGQKQPFHQRGRQRGR